MESRLHRGKRNAEPRGDLVARNILQIAQLIHRPRISGLSCATASRSSVASAAAAAISSGAAAVSCHFSTRRLPTPTAASGEAASRAPSTASKPAAQSVPATPGMMPNREIDRCCNMPSAVPRSTHLPRLRDSRTPAASAGRLRPYVRLPGPQNSLRRTAVSALRTLLQCASSNLPSCSRAGSTARAQADAPSRNNWWSRQRQVQLQQNRPARTTPG